MALRAGVKRVIFAVRRGANLSTSRGYAVASLLDDLTDRGFVRHVTSPQLRTALDSSPQTIYAGIDPTAQSLHIGHLIPLMCLLHFRLHGHAIIPLIGGATGRLGDPSGRYLERKPAVTKQVEDNVTLLTESVQTFFKRAFYYARARARNAHLCAQPVVISNLQWHQNFSLLDFLQHVGIHARVNTMLNRESVRARLESQHGLSFTEFTYQLLQAYDFYHLHKHFGCTVQVGGSDQWGNILAGLELIGRLGVSPAITNELPPAFGITTPLLTASSGEKFGKSAGNAVWLNPRLTSIFDFYQHFLNVEDADVEKFLKLFTLLPMSDIYDIITAHNERPEKRFGQRRLADEVTEMVHTDEGLTHAQTLTNLMFGSDHSNLKTNQILSAFKDDSRLVLVNEEELTDSSVMKLAAKYGLVPSGSASRALVQARGLYANNKPIVELQYKLSKVDLIDGRVAILRAGKNKFLTLVSCPC